MKFEVLHHSTEDARFSGEYMTEMILRFATPSEFHASRGSCIFMDAKSPGEHEFTCGNLGHGQWAASIARFHSHDDKPTVATIVVKDVNW